LIKKTPSQTYKTILRFQNQAKANILFKVIVNGKPSVTSSTTGQRAHENGLITDFRYIKSSIMEKLFFFIVFLLPRSIKTGKVKSTNLFLKLQIATI
jgi:hypothetical protein